MELSQDFLMIQGIFVSLKKEFGDLTKILHKGGNEKAIFNVISELRTFLSSKSYLKRNSPNPCFDDELYRITLFLMLNTHVKTRVEDPNYAHLIDIMPQISPCLLSNIILTLDLPKYYCKALESLDTNQIEELVNEMIPWLQKSNPQLCLETTYHILVRIIRIVTNSSKEHEESTEKLVNLAGLLLLNLTSVNAEQNIQLDSVYQMIGWSAWYLFHLLLKCDLEHPLLQNLIEKLLNSACTVLMSVTMDVFISWVEISFINVNLQTAVAEKAYEVCEKYMKFEQAQSLLSMLQTIARKPKNLEQTIQESDIGKNLSMVHEGGQNQRQWFKGLLNRKDVLEKEEIVDCITNYPHLCTMEDVVFLLDNSVGLQDSNAKKAVIRAASTLALDDLLIANARYFFKHGFVSNLNEDIQAQIILIFNKLQQNTDSNEFVKDIQLLLLQNPKMLMQLIFQECVKNTFYTNSFKGIFPTFREIAMIDSLAIKILQDLISLNKSNEQSLRNYIELFKTLVYVQFFTCEHVVLEIIFPEMQRDTSDSAITLYFLQIINGLNVGINVTEKSASFFRFLFDLMRINRCLVAEYQPIKHEILKETIDIINNCSMLENNYNGEPIQVESKDKFLNFYQKKLLQSDYSATLVEYLYPSYKMSTDGVLVSNLIKILPRCVTSEWISITSSLVNDLGLKSITNLCDLLILLSQVVISQQNQTEETKRMTNALKECLRNFGVAYKHTISRKELGPEENAALAIDICRLLKHIPDAMKKDLGLTLAHLIADSALKSKQNDPQFSNLIASIEEPCIVQMLTQKTLC